MKKSNELIVPAPAKINLALDIKGLRPDGYHEVEMIMQSISLHDIISLKRQESGITIKCNKEGLPLDERNLAYKAAERIMNELRSSKGVEISIDKKIPVAAGLAGGSTDAAAVLKGLNQLFDFNLDYHDLSCLAAEIGADVPFCLRGGTAIASGVGDNIEQLPDLEEWCLVIVTPPVEVSTAQVYQEFDRIKPEINLSINKLVKCIKGKHKIAWNEGWDNILEKVTEKFIDDISEIKEILWDRGCRYVKMTGSGPTVFAVCDNIKQAEDICESWPRENDFTTTAVTLKKDFWKL